MISVEKKSRVPIYEGKTLDQWLEMKGGIEPLPDEAREAVRKIGTNAIPHLLALMEHEDTAIKSFLYLHLPDVWNLRGYLTPYYVIQDRGVEGIKALGPAAKSILPVLTKLFYENSRFDAAEALVTMGDEGTKIVEGGLDSTNSFVRYCSVSVLSNSEGIRPEIISRFRRALTDRDPEVREAATNALAKLDVGRTKVTESK